jgi:hypothetical protein
MSTMRTTLTRCLSYHKRKSCPGELKGVVGCCCSHGGFSRSSSTTFFRDASVRRTNALDTASTLNAACRSEEWSGSTMFPLSRQYHVDNLACAEYDASPQDLLEKAMKTPVRHQNYPMNHSAYCI